MSSSPYYSPSFIILIFPFAIAYSFLSHLWIRLSGKGDISPLPTPDSSLAKKVAIVTGANTGIGYQTALRLAVEYNMTVVLACRSRDKGEQAARQIQKEGGKKAIFLVPLDVSSSKSIKHFSDAVKTNYYRIDVLVNNAGRASQGDPVEGTRDLIFQTNFLGHFELTSHLMSTFGPNARVINLASVLHHFTEGDVNKISFWKSCIEYSYTEAKNRYIVSKLAAILFTMELNRRYPNRIQSVAVNPGAV